MSSLWPYRCLRQNRRVVTCEERREELETFHQTLHDISYGIASENVQQFIVDAYVRGARMTATTVGFEGNTAVFTKRRYRDAWNRQIIKRVAEQHAHTIKIKAKVRAKGQRGTGWYNDLMVNYLRKRSRTAMLWSLTLSGDWHPDYETGPIPDMRAHHMMRCAA